MTWLVRFTFGFMALVIASAAPPDTQAVSAQVFTEPTRPAATPRPRSRSNSSTRSNRRRAAPAETAPVQQQPAAPAGFTDPQDYCTANPAMTVPGDDYIGGTPDWLVNGWKIASGNAQLSGTLATQWKCSQGRVMACATPIGEDWCGLPDTIEEPTPEMEEYCQENRSGAIPKTVTGNTLPVWICRRRAPRISGYRSDLDADGYLSDTWVDASPFSPANMVGAVPRSYLARWNVPVKVGIIGSLRRSGALVIDGRTDDLITTFAMMQIEGGDLGSVVGQTIYYGENASNQVGLTGCVADLILRDASQNSITVVERYRPGRRDCRDPEIFMLQENEGQLFVNWMREGRTRPKRSEWVQAFAGSSN